MLCPRPRPRPGRLGPPFLPLLPLLPPLFLFRGHRGRGGGKGGDSGRGDSTQGGRGSGRAGTRGGERGRAADAPLALSLKTENKHGPRAAASCLPDHSATDRVAPTGPQWDAGPGSPSKPRVFFPRGSHRRSAATRRSCSKRPRAS